MTGLGQCLWNSWSEIIPAECVLCRDSDLVKDGGAGSGELPAEAVSIVWKRHTICLTIYKGKGIFFSVANPGTDIDDITIRIAGVIELGSTQSEVSVTKASQRDRHLVRSIVNLGQSAADGNLSGASAP